MRKAEFRIQSLTCGSPSRLRSFALRVIALGGGNTTIALLVLTTACASAPPERVTPTTIPQTTRPAVQSTTGEIVDVTAPARPRPYPVEPSPAFLRAVSRETRTLTGEPGAKYWTQTAQYRLRAELVPDSRTINGSGTVTLLNRSPETLRRVAFHIHPNLFASNAVRNRFVPNVGGAELRRVVAQNANMRAVPVTDTTSTGYSVGGTIMWITVPTPIAPGATAAFDFEWSYVLPPDGAPRTGTDGDVFFVAYWYPQLAVFDDVNGWQTDLYMGNAEFYMGYADYEVSLVVPEGWLVGATGELQNAPEVLSEQTRTRLRQAHGGSRTVVNVVTANDRGAGTATARSTSGKLTWRYTARGVRDFAWGTSANYLWDATSAVVGDINGDGTVDASAINSFYRPERVAWAWDKSAQYAQFSIDFLSGYLWPYIYSHMTVMDGVSSCSGMEYPMITCIGGQRDTLSLFSVTVHEIAHMWFPMQVGSDEKRHSWQDEGLTRFNQAQAMRAYFNGYDLESIARDRYLNLARNSGEVELMRHGDLYPVGTPAFNIASYDKQATIMAALRGLLGTQTFLQAYREYGVRWLNKHPTVWDFWNTFESVSQRDLSWFWRTWYYETWTLDQAIRSVTQSGPDLKVFVEDRGLAPMPVLLAIIYADGSVQRHEVTVDAWLTGTRIIEVQITAKAVAQRVEIDPDGIYPDIDRTNQIWLRKQ